jgi:hypothetical protein
MATSFAEMPPELFAFVVSPTLMQNLRLTQETEEISTLPSDGPADHVWPDHMAYTVDPRPVVPFSCPLTSMQNVELTQETELGAELGPSGRAAAEDHEEPFQVV